MKTVLIGAVCNIVLDPLFIFALDMGVRGAALATVLSQAVSCVWVVTFLRGKQTLLRLEKASLPIRPRLILPAWPWVPPPSSCRPAKASSPCASTPPC